MPKPIQRSTATSDTLPAIVFDLDGTLIDSVGDIHANLNRVLTERGLRPLSRARVQSFVGNGVPTLIRRTMDHLGLDPADRADLTARFLHLYENDLTLTKPYPGVIAALEALRAAGHPLGICTNKPEAPTKAILDHLDLARFFPVVIGGDSLPQRKPDPAPLLATAKAIGRTILFVGDSEVDCETAQAAAVPFLLYTRGYRKSPVSALPHRAKFNAFTRLPGLVEKLLAAKPGGEKGE